MAKSKGPRVAILLECTNCRIATTKRKIGVSRYLTSKNRKNTPGKLELLKFCKFCNQRTMHKETK